MPANIYKHFSPKTDPVIDWQKVDHDSLRMLDKARGIAGIPFVITSHYRPGLNQGAHGEIPCGSFDLRARNARERFHILRGLFAAGFNRIGIDVSPGNSHIHVDNSKIQDQEVFWVE